jgi:hypothetical protein
MVAAADSGEMQEWNWWGHWGGCQELTQDLPLI